MWVPFHKYSACGNDFIVIDDRSVSFPVERSHLISQLCQRRTGVGADGLILLAASARADYQMRIFNADGSEAEMCGNGIRCLLPFLQSLGAPADTLLIETMQRILRITKRDNEVAVEMGPTSGIRWDVSIPCRDQVKIGHYLNTGVPHLVLFVDALDDIEVDREGRELRHHGLFAPHGVNVNFVECIAGKFAVRTYERGVEAETLACGTGATATALAIAKTTGAEGPIPVLTRSGQQLKVSFQRQGDCFHNIELCGPAHCVYRGEVFLFKRN